MIEVVATLGGLIVVLGFQSVWLLRYLDAKFTAIDQRFTAIDERFDRIETRLDRIEVGGHAHGERLASIEGWIRRAETQAE